jgi:hypothetical protein
MSKQNNKIITIKNKKNTTIWSVQSVNDKIMRINSDDWQIF